MHAGQPQAFPPRKAYYYSAGWERVFTARSNSTLAHHVQVVCGLSRGRAETWEPTRSWLAQDLEPAIAQQRARNLSQQRRERELFALEAAERVSDAVLR